MIWRFLWNRFFKVHSAIRPWSFSVEKENDGRFARTVKLHYASKEDLVQSSFKWLLGIEWAPIFTPWLYIWYMSALRAPLPSAYIQGLTDRCRRETECLWGSSYRHCLVIRDLSTVCFAHLGDSDSKRRHLWYFRNSFFVLPTSPCMCQLPSDRQWLCTPSAVNSVPTITITGLTPNLWNILFQKNVSWIIA